LCPSPGPAALAGFQHAPGQGPGPDAHPPLPQTHPAPLACSPDFKAILSALQAMRRGLKGATPPLPRYEVKIGPQPWLLRRQVGPAVRAREPARAAIPPAARRLIGAAARCLVAPFLPNPTAPPHPCQDADAGSDAAGEGDDGGDDGDGGDTAALPPPPPLAARAAAKRPPVYFPVDSLGASSAALEPGALELAAAAARPPLGPAGSGSGAGGDGGDGAGSGGAGSGSGAGAGSGGDGAAVPERLEVVVEGGATVSSWGATDSGAAAAPGSSGARSSGGSTSSGAVACPAAGALQPPGAAP
jgi:hypothetical protein